MDNTATNIAESVMEKIKEMVDANTIIGEPIITPAGVTIIPISKVNVGFGMGGSKDNKEESVKKILAGGAGGGITITPVAFLSITGENVRLITIDKNESTVDKALGMLPELIDKAINAFTSDKNQTDAEI